MNPARPATIVFMAPGAGMGHIVRVSAVSLALRKQGCPSIIITTSPWAEALARITGTETICIPISEWETGLVSCLKKTSPGILVQDSFPLGLRSENPRSVFADIPFVYLARVLNTDAYLSAVKRNKTFFDSAMTTIIRIEPLTAAHEEMIASSGCRSVTLKQRIAFPFRSYISEIPEGLDYSLDNTDVHLVVHSGPVHETEELLNLAKERICIAGNGTIAVINPFFFRDGRQDAWDYFPAAALYDRSRHIYSGGGYNAVAEQIPFQDKVTRIPFERRYDDQKFRLDHISETSEGEQGGAEEAASLIAEIYLQIYG